jgi:hypothetical protein
MIGIALLSVRVDFSAQLIPLTTFNETICLTVRINHMEYRGIEFTVVQAIQRGKWKWSVSGVDLVNRSGLAENKHEAAADARKAISWLLAAKMRQLRMCSAIEEARD